MSIVFPQQSLDFLAELSENNSKAWMDANRRRYERELKGPAREFASAVNGVLERIAPGHASAAPHKNLSRINRDIRFSKDKTPYNTHVWAGWMMGGGKGPGAGFYVGVSPTDFGVGAGAWKPDKVQLSALRDHLATHHAVLTEMMAEPDVAELYGSIGGDALKRVPKPWTADHPAAEWLKLKSMVLRSTGDVDLVTSDGFLDELERRLSLLVPIVDFLNDGMGLT